MRILLARHGETPWNAEGRYQGQEDIPLSDVGIAQAAALGERLREMRIDRAVASPLSRARRTAELALGAARASQLQLDDGLKEIAHGEWEGLLAGEIRERDGERLRAWREAPDTVQMPGAGGESLQQVLDRAWPAFARACAFAMRPAPVTGSSHSPWNINVWPSSAAGIVPGAATGSVAAPAVGSAKPSSTSVDRSRCRSPP